MLRRELAEVCDGGPRRPATQGEAEDGDGAGGAGRVHFHGAISPIADGAAQPQARRLPACPPAEADALYATLNDDSDTRFDDIWLHGPATVGCRARSSGGRGRGSRSE